MTERSRFWTTSGGGDSDTIVRDVWWDIWLSLLGSLRNTTYQGGLLNGSGDGSNPPLFVEETATPSAAVKVNIGRAILRGAWYEADAAETVAIAANTDGSGFARIDYIILRKDVAAQTVRLINLLGTPAASPVAPTLTQTEGVTWEIPIAQIAVANLFSTIVDADISYDRPNGIGQYAIIRQTEEGGTGLTSYVDGDLIAASAVNTLGKIPTLAVDGAALVRDAVQSPKYAMVDRRITRIFKSSNTNLEALATPIPIDGQDDLASNMRAAVSASRFYPEAGTYKIWGWIVMQNVTTNTENYLFLYDTNAAANVLDIDGEQVRSVVRDFVSAFPHWNFFECWVTFDGTENVETRAIATANHRYGPETTSYRPFVLFVERQY